MSILDYMTTKHRECDDYFAAAEQAVSSEDWSDAETAWQQFSEELEAHLSSEEETLFPAFEAKTGMTAGPTAVMRAEHQQMRQLVQDLTLALQARESDRYLGLSETLMILMQQHNMKEEQILYPMSDQVIDDKLSMLEKLGQR